MRNCQLSLAVLGAVAVLVCLGCAQDSRRPGISSISQRRAERRAAVSAEFQKRYAEAALLEAQQSFRAGDYEQAEARVAAVLRRDADHPGALDLAARLSQVGSGTDHHGWDAPHAEAAGDAEDDRLPGEVTITSFAAKTDEKVQPASGQTNVEDALQTGADLEATGARDRSTRWNLPPSAHESLEAGLEALHAGALEEARLLFREVVSASPRPHDTARKIAVLAIEANHPNVAVELLEGKDPPRNQSNRFYQTRAVALYRLGRYADARVDLRRALSLDNTDPLSYFLLGCTVAKLGQSAQAEEHFATAATLDPRYAGARPL